MSETTQPSGEDEDSRRAATALADQMRRIISRLAVARPSAEELARAAETAASFADRLDELPERSRDWEVSEAGLLPRDFLAYSPITGRSNALAPPARFRVVDDEQVGHRIVGTVTFGPAYEGPPGHVHGGFLAALFDELLGYAQLAPGFTGTLTVTYRTPTPLNRPLELNAWLASQEGRKRLARGEIHLDGVLLAQAEGLFIAPRSDEEYRAKLGIADPV